VGTKIKKNGRRSIVLEGSDMYSHRVAALPLHLWSSLYAAFPARWPQASPSLLASPQSSPGKPRSPLAIPIQTAMMREEEEKEGGNTGGQYNKF